MLTPTILRAWPGILAQDFPSGLLIPSAIPAHTHMHYLSLSQPACDLRTPLYARTHAPGPCLPAGIRPKVSGPGQPAADFIIQGPQQHGVPGYVALYVSWCREAGGCLQP
jgi:hypothetical protein